MVPFLDLFVGSQQRFDQVIDRGAGSDRSQIRTYFPSDAADGVAQDATQFFAPVYGFAPVRIALVPSLFNEFAESFGSDGPARRDQVAGFFDG